MQALPDSPAELGAADIFSSSCVSRTALQHLTGRWGALVLVALRLQGNPMRFGEIRRRIEGISDRMLSQTLGQLERDGMVERTVHSTIPPNVDYQLTSLGLRVAEPLEALAELIEAHALDIVAAQISYDDAVTERNTHVATRS